VQFDAGKFFSPVGFETIETAGNWNYSRSLAFALGMPYYHMGVRATYTPHPRVRIIGYVVNGWNNVVDNNGAKTAGATMSIRWSRNIELLATYLIGPEQNNDNHSIRQMSHSQVVWTATPRLTLVMNYDWDDDSVSATGPWGEGVSAYAHYRPADWFKWSTRVEQYFDKGAFATGMRQRLKDVTLTGELARGEGVTVMIEYRHDFSNKLYYPRHDGEISKTADTMTVGLVYAFSARVR